jgi:hypothetical protein
MNCCPNCFVDPEIKGIITSISLQNGSCDYCGAQEQAIIAIDELQEAFAPLLELYEQTDKSQNDLFMQINLDWNVFFNNTPCRRVLNDICGEKYSFLLQSNVELKYTANDSVVDWANFVNEIKSENRFFIQKNAIVRDVVRELLNRHTKTIKAGTVLFRGRISDTENGFPLEKLFQPPRDKATPGRANPEGISYLYLAKERETTLYEIGASLNDYVCIGEFELLEDIKIVVLREVQNISPFLEDVNLEEYVKNKDILTQFGIALSTPLRSFDSSREYLPTQYLCEYVKSLGIDGVEYASAMNKGGTNYAIFDGNKFKCVNKTMVVVKEISVKIGE